MAIIPQTTLTPGTAAHFHYIDRYEDNEKLKSEILFSKYNDWQLKHVELMDKFIDQDATWEEYNNSPKYKN